MITVRPDAAAWQEVDGQLVLLDTRSSRYLGINRAGAILWSRLVEGATMEDLATHLAREMELSPEAVTGDVEAFVSELENRGLVDVAP